MAVDDNESAQTGSIRGDGSYFPPASSYDAEEKERTQSDDDNEKFTRVEVERMDGERQGMPSSLQIMQLPNPPFWSTWLCLILAWLFLGSAVPLTIFIGAPLNIAALFLALTCIARGGLFTGLLVLFLGTAGSVFVYMVGLFRFISALIV